MDEPEAESKLPDDSLEARALREDVAGDKLARAVARSKIMSALFAKDAPVTVGRYHLLEQVGAGGMGVVWGAWDPELERRVAIKVVKPQLAAARERIVREGQALAKLSHPHVVPVFDVGVVDEQVYLVMEWVRGATLRKWVTEPRAVRDIVRVYRESAMGLAAAHAVGLVHRDFKPENAMIGEDDRVRVLDFGLAREGGAAQGVAGTPRYMAPEQAAATDITPAVDQFSLGVALREALEAHTKELPKWLAAIVARATAPIAADRFPSMTALVDALAHDPARVLRRRLAIAGAVGLAGAAFAIGMNANESAEERCAGGRTALTSVWNPRARDVMSMHLRSLGPYGAQVAERAGKELDAYARRWGDAHVGACRAHDRGELTAEVYNAHLACLARSRVALETARDVLGAMPLERLQTAMQVVQLLPAAERCGTEALTPPPAAIAERVAQVGADVSRAFVLAQALDPAAIKTADEAARAAEAVGYPQLIGRASLVHGVALLLQQKRSTAATALATAADAALEASDNATAVEAIARRIFAVHTDNNPTAASVFASLELAKPIAKGLTGRDAFARALYYNNLGTLQLRDAPEVARDWLEQAERVRPPPTRDTFELASIAGNLALIEPDRTKRDALLAREGAELEAALGSDHPLTLDAHLKAAMLVEHPERAAEGLRDPCARLRRMHAHLLEAIAHCAYEIAWLAEERGDLVEAADALSAITMPTSLENQLAAGYRDLLAGKHADVAQTMSALADKLAAGKFWPKWRSVDARLLVAIAADKLGDRATMIAQAEQALVTIDELGDFSKSTFVQRRRGRVLAMLVLGGQAQHLEAALAWAQLAGYEQRIAALSSR